VSKNLQRLVETYSVSNIREISNPLNEQKQWLTEASSQYNIPKNVKKKLYKFPISRFGNKNYNGRVYTRELWENVKNKQRQIWERTVGLADHPFGEEEDAGGEFKNSAVIWYDLEIDDATNLVYAIGLLVGNYGDLAQEIIDNQGRIGFSTSGFGEFMNDGTTVNPDTYTIERIADIVLNPSQDVFGDGSNELNIEYSRGNMPRNDSPTEDPEDILMGEAEKAGIIEETRNSKTQSNIFKEMLKMTESRNAISKIEEKKFRRDIQTFLEDASKIEHPQARLKELEEIISYFEGGFAPDLKEQVETRILEEKENLEAMVEKARATQETFGIKDPEELKVGVALLAEEVKVAEADAKDWEKIALALKENNQKLRLALKEANAKFNTLPAPSYVGELLEKLENYKATAAVMKRNSAKASKSLKEAELEINSLTEQISSLKHKNKITIKEARREKEALIEQINSYKSRYKSLKEEVEEAENKLEDEEQKDQKQEEQIQVLESQVSRLQARLKEEISKYKELEESYNVPLGSMVQPASKRIGSYLNFNEADGAAVEQYWADLVARHGATIRPYEHQIRGSKTYKEASAAYVKVLSALDDSADVARLPESVSISKTERKEMLEQAGMQFTKTKDMKLPKGWV
jgi:hypothetical protein